MGTEPEKVLAEAAAELVGAIERGDDHQTVLRAASAVNQALAALAPDPGAAGETTCICFVGPAVAAYCPVHHPGAAGEVDIPYPAGHDDCIATVEHFHARPYVSGDWSCGHANECVCTETGHESCCGARREHWLAALRDTAPAQRCTCGVQSDDPKYEKGHASWCPVRDTAPAPDVDLDWLIDHSVPTHGDWCFLLEPDEACVCGVSERYEAILASRRSLP